MSSSNPPPVQQAVSHSVSAHELIPELCQNRAILALVLFSQALVIVLVILSSGLLDFKWETYGALSFYVMWTVLLCAAGLCALRNRLKSQSINHIMGWSFFITLSINFAVSVSAQWAYWLVFYQDLGADWLLKNSLITTILTALILHYFYLGWQNRLQAQSESEARVQALQSRIRPHFLFNSMNIIASLIHEDPDKAELAVEDLSELFRASLKQAGNEVTLKQEIALCEKYISIEQLRLGKRLNVNWQVDANLVSNIPLLTLQPLIENAIYHGIAPSPNGGEVMVQIKQLDQTIHIDVQNPLAPNASRQNSREKGNQMALENIKHRLNALYAKHDQTVKVDAEQTEESYKIHIEYQQSQPYGDNRL